MNRRTRPSHRSPPSRSEPYLKYLKPGALAQIRDSRMISARSHRTIAPSHQIRSSPPSSPPSTPGHSPSVVAAAAAAATMTAATEGFLFFSGRAYGARCPQRKRLVAAKSAVLFPPMAASPAIIDVSSDNPIIDVFGGGGDIAAH